MKYNRSRTDKNKLYLIMKLNRKDPGKPDINVYKILKNCPL